jgi:hypothetical protein
LIYIPDFLLQINGTHVSSEEDWDHCGRQCKQHLRENKNQMGFGDHWLI